MKYFFKFSTAEWSSYWQTIDLFKIRYKALCLLMQFIAEIYAGSEVWWMQRPGPHKSPSDAIKCLHILDNGEVWTEIIGDERTVSGLFIFLQSAEVRNSLIAWLYV